MNPQEFKAYLEDLPESSLIQAMKEFFEKK